jgi:hypothetical protein
MVCTLPHSNSGRLSTQSGGEKDEIHALTHSRNCFIRLARRFHRRYPAVGVHSPVRLTLVLPP